MTQQIEVGSVWHCYSGTVRVHECKVVSVHGGKVNRMLTSGPTSGSCYELSVGEFVTCWEPAPQPFAVHVEQVEPPALFGLDAWKPGESVWSNQTTTPLTREAYLDALREMGANAHAPVYAGQVVLSCGKPKVLHAPPTRCPRCQGPACELLYSFRCERVGGCRTESERIGAPVLSCVSTGSPYSPEVNWIAESGEPLAPGMGRIYDDSHVAMLRAQGAVYGYHPTREGAIAAWREKALAAERGK